MFVDIEPDSYNIDPAGIEGRLTDKTRGIIPVGLYGQCADMESIGRIAREWGLFVVEDACQSFGAVRNGTPSCGFPGIGATSFFPSKPLGCYGDGGMLFTSDDALADRMRGLRNHGQWERYRHRVVGINGRLDEIQAAVLLAKLPRFREEVAARARIGARYSERLADVVKVRQHVEVTVVDIRDAARIEHQPGQRRHHAGGCHRAGTVRLNDAVGLDARAGPAGQVND